MIAQMEADLELNNFRSRNYVLIRIIYTAFSSYDALYMPQECQRVMQWGRGIMESYLALYFIKHDNDKCAGKISTHEWLRVYVYHERAIVCCEYL